jgi:predicted aldo/keto reductase-like oxidoreductase
MEPVRGGRLVNLPNEAQKIIDELQTEEQAGHRSNASYAIRFAASFPQVMMVLSGMSDMDQMNDNISYMKEFEPLSEKEHEALRQVCDILVEQNLIPCTACKYCVDGCPKQIPISDLFQDYNDKACRCATDIDSDANYKLHTEGKGKASDCIGCGKCEKECPQHLEIRKLLKRTAWAFENY